MPQYLLNSVFSIFPMDAIHPTSNSDFVTLQTLHFENVSIMGYYGVVCVDSPGAILPATHNLGFICSKGELLLVVVKVEHYSLGQ